MHFHRRSINAIIFLLAATVTAHSLPRVVLTEIMYRPQSENSTEEFIEIHNAGPDTINLENWRISGEVDFIFPELLLEPGIYHVIAADPEQLRSIQPELSDLSGPWKGKLGNNGGVIRLQNDQNERVDAVRYASQGEWARRARGIEDRGFKGWIWVASHDGQGSSLELRNPKLPNEYGSNWSSSRTPGGSPGNPNSQGTNNLAPMILDVSHSPAVPRSFETVRIRCRLIDEDPGSLSVNLLFRTIDLSDFQSLPMHPNVDQPASETSGIEYSTTMPALPSSSIVEFYIEAKDSEGNLRTSPPPVIPSGDQEANYLYQVDDEPYFGSMPGYRFIMTRKEEADLKAIGNLSWFESSNARMNATLIYREAGKTVIRYNIGIRLRGGTSRTHHPKNRRIQIPNDRPLNGRRAIVLNALRPHSQIIGSAIFRSAGLAVQRVRPAHVIENNLRPALEVSAPFQFHAEMDALNSDFAEELFPNDANGNLYRAHGYGTLEYLGEDPTAYSTLGFYQKNSNASENDWSDLIGLTQALNQVSPEVSYLDSISQVLNIKQWIDYLAVNTLIGNEETSLATGRTGDYALYRGSKDPRFHLLAYDLDTVLGTLGGLESPLFRAAANPALARFLNHPDIARMYYQSLIDHLHSTFSPKNLNPLIDQFLAPMVTEPTRTQLKNFAKGRTGFVLAQIPDRLSLVSTVPETNSTTEPTIDLTGRASPLSTAEVRVNGIPATWTVWKAEWQLEDVPLNLGINEIVVQALDGAGLVIDEMTVPIRRETDTFKEFSGSLPADTVWTQNDGPYLIRESVIIPSGVELRILPGTTIYFQSGQGLMVKGRLMAEGTELSRIQMSVMPGTPGKWYGIRFDHSLVNNRLHYVHMKSPGKHAVHLTHSRLSIDHVEWSGTTQNILWSDESSIEVRHSIFPDILHDEHVQGNGINLPDNAVLLFENNLFGTTAGYQDIIDFSAVKSPGPILEIINNRFTGGSDDILDLDGIDALIEGNVFSNVRKNNTSTSLATAIATGRDHLGRTSVITVIRNLFLNNENDILLKENALMEASNNTFIGTLGSSIALGELERSSVLPMGGTVTGSIFWEVGSVIGNFNPLHLTEKRINIEVSQSLIPQTGIWAGDDNLIDTDPRFVNVEENDFRLRNNSPAKGNGPNGSDRGYFIPGGPSISGIPDGITHLDHALITIKGPGITHYRYQLDNGPFSDAIPVIIPIELTSLGAGTHRLKVTGLNVAGQWQSEESATLSETWTVDPGFSLLQLNEVSAITLDAGPDNRPAPGYVEVYYTGRESFDLSGLGITDDLNQPFRFLFPEETILEPDSYLIIHEGTTEDPSTLHLGFGISGKGESIFLFDRELNGGELLDKVDFGFQLPNRSIGRISRSGWQLNEPTPGKKNRRSPTGTKDELIISEWFTNSGKSNMKDFVEIHNRDTLPVDVGNLYLTDHPISIPNRHQLKPLNFIDSGGTRIWIADGEPDLGTDHLNFRLNSQQGMIGLFSSELQRLDQILYNHQTPGSSEGRTVNGTFEILTFESPNPGIQVISPSSYPGLKINEIMAAGDSGSSTVFQTDWIELLNDSQQEIDLSGFSLSNTSEIPEKWQFKPGTRIPAESFLSIDFDDRSPASIRNTGFSLNDTGDAVFLFVPPDHGGSLLDYVQFGIQTPDHSIGLQVSDMTTWKLNQPTPNLKNIETTLDPSDQLRINEWLALPEPGLEDGFEIVNPGSNPVELSGLLLSDSFEISDADTFPGLSFISTGDNGFLWITADRKTDQGADHVSFKLSSNGDRIGLFRPGRHPIDQIEFGQQQRGVYQGRLPDGGTDIVSLTEGGTPGSANHPKSNGGSNPPPLPVWDGLIFENNGSVVIAWTADPGKAFRVESTKQLKNPIWIPHGSIITSPEGRAFLVDPTAVSPSRFYRIHPNP